jgi:NAD(P)-dependent dehydrogenase (short-subunit alcohol dehydrogenase family)
MTEPTIPSGGLEGYSVIVSGGGTGIGRGAAARLIRDGAAVTICGRTESSLQDAVLRIAPLAGHGGSVQYVVADMTDEGDVQRVVEQSLAPTGALNGFFANAGGGGIPGPFHLQNTEEFLRVLNVNVLSTFLSIKHSVPHLVAAGGGSFVGMSSIAGHQTHRYFGAYTAAKAAIEQLMRNAADEYGPVHVRFNAVRPGFIATEIMEHIPRDSEVYSGWIANTPMGDVGQSEDVAGLVRYLIGPESRWVTGTIINIDGGNALRSGPNFKPFVEPMYGADALLAKAPPPARN